MPLHKPHKKTQKRLQKIIQTALKNVMDDYETLFAESGKNVASAETLAEKYKQGKIILAHIATLIKLTEAYSNSASHADAQYNDDLITAARQSLEQERHNDKDE